MGGPTPNVESRRVAVVLVEGVGDDTPGQTAATAAAALVDALGRDVPGGAREIPVVVPGPPGARREVHRAQARTLTRTVGRATHRIDLVEMRWSDLSRFPSGLVRFFVALFGFALQIATVGLEAVHRPAAGAADADPRPARGRAWPVAAALALGAACGAAAAAGRGAAAGVLAGGLAAGAVLLATVLWREPDTLAAANRLQDAASWWLAAVVIPGTVATATAGVAFWLAIEGTLGPGGLGVAVALLGGLAAAVALGRGLAEGGWRYGGAGWQRVLDPRWWSVGLVALAGLLTCLRWADTGSPAAGTARALLEVAGFGLRGAWLVMASLTIVTLALLVASIPTQRDAWFTSVATTVLSPLVVATVGVLLIGGIGTVAFATSADETWGADLRHVRCLESPGDWTTGQRCAEASLRGDWLPVRDGIVATAERAAVLDAVVVPARRRGAVRSPAMDDAAARGDAAEARRLRDLATAAERDAEATPVDWAKDVYRTTTLPLGWILIATAGLGLLAVAAYLAGPVASPAERLTRGLRRLTGRTAAGLLAAGGLLAAAWMWAVWTGGDVRWPAPGVASVTGAGVGSAVVLGALAALRFLPVDPRRLTASVGGGLEALRRLIDRGYDVATYLRIDRGDGVRTRVVARFRALLDELAEDHDVIVIAAHSQGSMYAIATLMGDAYRREPEPGSRWGVRPLSEVEGCEGAAGALSGLLTFGCPIRQTYAARLPGKYAWTGSPASVAARLGPLGLSWVNVHRARDFIGREVFHEPGAGPAGPGEGRRAPLPGAGPGIEAIDVWLRGSGHHTGYWGDVELALWLDRMLRRATGEPDRGPPPGYVVT